MRRDISILTAAGGAAIVLLLTNVARFGGAPEVRPPVISPAAASTGGRLQGAVGRQGDRVSPMPNEDGAWDAGHRRRQLDGVPIVGRVRRTKSVDGIEIRSARIARDFEEEPRADDWPLDPTDAPDDYAEAGNATGDPEEVLQALRDEGYESLEAFIDELRTSLQLPPDTRVELRVEPAGELQEPSLAVDIIPGGSIADEKSAP